jgi:hypothetical protein
MQIPPADSIWPRQPFHDFFWLALPLVQMFGLFVLSGKAQGSFMIAGFLQNHVCDSAKVFVMFVLYFERVDDCVSCFLTRDF